uniref:DHHA2 domain-containing protein n=1 Tax=Aplanochytrium stocchinoi TaxID=215587 RepID=A0A7S3V092_9STRA
MYLFSFHLLVSSYYRINQSILYCQGAYLFQGLAAIPGAINAESKFVLDRYDLPYPGQLDSVYKHGSAYVLVDHNDRFQVPPLLRGNPDDIRGIIDHHTLAQIPAKASKPTYVQIRPWGSCSTIIATLYSDFDIPIPPSIAGLLLGGIISDTLGLKGPTTTGVDRSVAISLAAIVTGSGANEHFKQSHHENKHDHKKWDFDNFIHSLALEQFQAKANQTSKSLYAIATSDFKVYEISHIDDKGNRKMFKVGWGTVETVEPFYSQYLRKATISELDLAVLPRIMKEQKLDLIYLSIVDILEQTSVFLACCTEEDVQVLEEAFPGQKILRTFKGPDGDTDGVELQGKGVSRKKEFIPPLKNSLLRSPPP